MIAFKTILATLVLFALALPAESVFALVPTVEACEMVCCGASGEDARTHCPCTLPCGSCFQTPLAMGALQGYDASAFSFKSTSYETIAEFASSRFSRPDVPPPRDNLTFCCSILMTGDFPYRQGF